MMTSKTVFFLCTGNSCRSQMAEGWARHLKSDSISPFSAGTVAKGLDPRAVRVMSEAGVDISSQKSKTIADLAGIEPEIVVTVCSSASESCPVFPGNVKRIHRGFDDPPQLAKEESNENRILEHYRRVRDEIREFILKSF